MCFSPATFHSSASTAHGTGQKLISATRSGLRRPGLAFENPNAGTLDGGQHQNAGRTRKSTQKSEAPCLPIPLVLPMAPAASPHPVTVSISGLRRARRIAKNFSGVTSIRTSICQRGHGCHRADHPSWRRRQQQEPHRPDQNVPKGVRNEATHTAGALRQEPFEDRRASP